MPRPVCRSRALTRTESWAVSHIGHSNPKPWPHTVVFRPWTDQVCVTRPIPLNVP